jgi:Flp pilus assembly protein TadG
MRRGVAAVEMALLAPPLVFLSFAAMDFGRVFYYASTIENCARNGALYACDPVGQSISPYTSVTQAALADASNISPTPTVSSTTGTDASGNDYSAVTVTYQFKTIVSYPGIPSTVNLARTVQMRTLSATPN